jgi:hypothetical protein
MIRWQECRELIVKISFTAAAQVFLIAGSVTWGGFVLLAL